MSFHYDDEPPTETIARQRHIEAYDIDRAIHWDISAIYDDTYIEDRYISSSFTLVAIR
jgi:hypothetical protein